MLCFDKNEESKQLKLGQVAEVTHLVFCTLPSDAAIFSLRLQLSRSFKIR